MQILYPIYIFTLNRHLGRHLKIWSSIKMVLILLKSGCGDLSSGISLVLISVTVFKLVVAYEASFALTLRKGDTIPRLKGVKKATLKKVTKGDKKP